MKLTKKVLAIVMALGLVVCMAAMAFAADEGKYTVELVKKGNEVTATIYAENFTGLTSGTVTLFTKNLKHKNSAKGADALLCDKVSGNTFSAECNTKTADKYIYGFYFADNLWTAEKFAEKSVEEPVKVNSDKFQLAVVKFELIDAAAEFEATAEADAKFIDGKNSSAVEVKVLPELPADETTTAATAETTTCSGDCTTTEKCTCQDTTNCTCPCQDTTDCTCTCQETTTSGVKTDGGKDKETGDNGVLAVMTGVIALAGAAFVATKKRK